jgi:dTDP-4-amino-4,6-dideoxygalactose transaminase
MLSVQNNVEAASAPDGIVACPGSTKCPLMGGVLALKTIPINDLSRVFAGHAAEIAKAVSEVMASGWWLNGSRLSAFTAAFSQYLGGRRCIGVANGTDALEIAFRALRGTGLARGDEVVTVANAGGYATVAARLAGLTPAYADIDEDTQLASIDSILATLGAETGCVVATHLYGGVLDVPALRQRMDAAGYGHVPILEDCAQAHGARTGDGRMAGTLGAVATFSFYPTKNLGAFGDAGAVVTADHALAERCDALRQYGWSGKYNVEHGNGRNSRMDEIQAAILFVLLPALEVANARRMAILDRYREACPDHVRVVGRKGSGVAHLAVVLCEDRDGLRRHLAAQGVATDIHYPILDCDQPAWHALPQRVVPGGLPVARASVGRLLTLPCFPAMTETEIELVSEALSTWRI